VAATLGLLPGTGEIMRAVRVSRYLKAFLLVALVALVSASFKRSQRIRCASPRRHSDGEQKISEN
jgi:hypothetical protein